MAEIETKKEKVKVEESKKNMEDDYRREEKVKIEGDEKLTHSVKTLRDQNEKKSDDESYEDIFNTVLSDKKLTLQLRKYVQKTPNDKNNVIAIRHRNIAVEQCNKGNLEDALKRVNTCLCFSSFSPEEMARTYCLRAGVYFGLKLYEFCLNDLNRAESFGYQGNTKYVLNHIISFRYYKLKESESALQNDSKGVDFKDPLREDEYIILRFQDLKLQAEACMKEQDKNKVEAEQEIADKMMNLNLESRPNATESESLKMEEGVLLDKKNRNINTNESENVDIDFSGITESTRPRVQGMTREYLKQNAFRTFLEILDAEDSNNSFYYSAITLNAASSNSFCQDGSNSGREFSDDVEFCYDPETGFRLKAKNKLTPGTIITTDIPYVANVNPDIRRYYCCYCFQRADIMMIPCNYCNEVRFCSEECRIKGWRKFHYVDCGYSGFLSRTDQTGYLCMRILLKMGMQKIAFLNPQEPIGFKDHNPNLKDREEYYRFLYNIPLKNSSASNKTEAALGAVIMLIFLEKMYTKISSVENGSLIADAIKPSDYFAKKTFTQGEKELLGLRIVKHWLQLDVESLKVRNKRLYITCLDDEIIGSNYEDTADYVLPLLHLFNHSCDPNVYSVRFEGGPEIFRVARTVHPGEFLTVAKGTDIYRDDFGVRYGLLKKDCACEACNLEFERFISKKPKVKELVDKLTRAEEFLIQEQYEKGLNLILGLFKQERLDDWMFWRQQRCIIAALHSSHSSPKEQSGRSTPESVIEVVKSAVQALNNLDLLQVSLCAFAPFGLILFKYVKMIQKLSVSVPSALNTPNGQKTLSELLQLMQYFKKKFLVISMKTHHEICISSMLRSEERSLTALIERNMSS